MSGSIFSYRFPFFGSVLDYHLHQLKCFVGSELPVYKANSLKQEISTIAYNLEHELSEMIADARESVA
ncbi:MAG: hypothetical protein WAQ98_16240 [Blastocatellia bacterium]